MKRTSDSPKIGLMKLEKGIVLTIEGRIVSPNRFITKSKRRRSNGRRINYPNAQNS